MREISGQNQLAQPVDALFELVLGHAVQNTALLLIYQTYGLRQMVTFVDTALAAVEPGEWTLHFHLVRIVRAAVVEVVAEASDQQRQSIQITGTQNDPLNHVPIKPYSIRVHLRIPRSTSRRLCRSVNPKCATEKACVQL